MDEHDNKTGSQKQGGWTPGPWTTTFSFPGLTPGIGDTWQIDADGHAVCTTQFCYASGTEANARLIAAAPDLYEALAEYDLAFSEFDPESAKSRSRMRMAVIKARSALSRANPSTDQGEG